MIETKGVAEITEEIFDDTCKLKLREMSKAVEFIVQQIKNYHEVHVQSLEDRKKYVLKYFTSGKGVFFKRESKKYIGFMGGE